MSEWWQKSPTASSYAPTATGDEHDVGFVRGRTDPGWSAEADPRPLRRRNLLFIANYLESAPCVDCGEADPAVLDFDHVGVKRYGVVQLAYREASIASLEREIAECEVRCANCHRRRTAIQQGHFRNHLIGPP